LLDLLLNGFPERKSHFHSDHIILAKTRLSFGNDYKQAAQYAPLRNSGFNATKVMSVGNAGCGDAQCAPVQSHCYKSYKILLMRNASNHEQFIRAAERLNLFFFEKNCSVGARIARLVVRRCRQTKSFAILLALLKTNCQDFDDTKYYIIIFTNDKK
jgi:hypothetical protein